MEQKRLLFKILLRFRHFFPPDFYEEKILLFEIAVQHFDIFLYSIIQS